MGSNADHSYNASPNTSNIIKTEFLKLFTEYQVLPSSFFGLTD